MTDKKHANTTSQTDWPTKKTARQFDTYQLDPEDVCIIDVEPPATYNDSEHAGETWANYLCSGFGDNTLYAPNFDATTKGNIEGINVLILRADLDWWIKQCEELGCEYEIIYNVEPGHYGDSNWSGIDLAKAKDKVYWIELEK